MIIDHPDQCHVAALRALWQQAFQDPEPFLDSFFRTAFSYDRCRCVFVAGQPVAAVYLFDCQWESRKCAYLYALAVDKAHRGQGLSRLLLTDTHAFLRQQGYAGAVIEAADTSLWAYYTRLGYRAFGGRQEILAEAGAVPCSAAVCGALAFARARAALLPENGIRQEGAVLELLQAQAKLLCGPDFTAVVLPEEGIVPEFLGNPERLPGLLAWLGLPKARVRIPGGAKSSLYLSLDESSSLPAYFGLPLD